jgi:hypothetical protein
MISSNFLKNALINMKKVVVRKLGMMHKIMVILLHHYIGGHNKILLINIEILFGKI